MRDFMAMQRLAYFNEIAEIAGHHDINLIVVTHLLEDRPELLTALSRIGTVSAVLAIPYSIHGPTYNSLQNTYQILTPTLSELYDTKYLKQVLQRYATDKPTILLEIGGYFAKVLPILSQETKSSLLGVIEDTELGHREYLKIQNRLPCPVLSVARSALKETEDFLIGSSCLFSTEKILRQSGTPIEGKRSLVLGFGKVGRGIAHSLLRHHCPVQIYDIDPIKRINALSEGFQIPDKNQAFCEAEIIYGTTGTCSIVGEEMNLLRNGVMLVSCSSKDIEFDIPYLDDYYEKEILLDNLIRYKNASHSLYLSGNGRPINFIDGAVIGPVLSLVQAEILLAIPAIIELSKKTGLFETESSTKQVLAAKWLNHFCDGSTGRYIHG